VDVLGLRTLDAAAEGELDPLVCLEAAEAATLDGGVVDEDTIARARRSPGQHTA
jgi:hypothetical protein